jgi:EAL domain-containing protein (putative c-di-GMP-specific phosphodiesterase class I)/GGDEF domain-containing protein
VHSSVDNSGTTPYAPDRLSAAVESCTGKFAVGIIALTNLGTLQERYGDDGNKLIAEVFRQRIATLFRPDDDMIVIADDSVCILIDDLLDSNHLHLAGLKIDRIFDLPADTAGQPISMTVQSGLVYAGRRTRLSKTPAELYQLAEDACCAAVVASKPFEIVNATDDQRIDNDWLLNQRLQAAMENHHISFDYQPKINLISGDLAGGEALIRWRDNGRIIPPDEYLAALSDDLLWQLTIYGYRRVLREILDHEIAVPVSFNIDPSSLAQKDFLDFMRRETTLWGVPPEQIMLEITESKEFFDLSQSRSLLESIRSSGFRISLDDFGTGHSNMQRIRELPLDEIKLDRSLCGNVLENEDARQITQSVANLASALKIPTCAEGIEDASTMAMLKELGCTLGQGFFLGAPTSVEVFADL